ncbi:MAG: hypothetical protein IPJ59_35835 [Nannocystis sp.]|nr:hypothetical protein [Nannocystis sp.]MBK7830514.1 hypothetical protein [Nannocystis sp.]
MQAHGAARADDDLGLAVGVEVGDAGVAVALAVEPHGRALVVVDGVADDDLLLAVLVEVGDGGDEEGVAVLADATLAAVGVEDDRASDDLRRAVAVEVGDRRVAAAVQGLGAVDLAGPGEGAVVLEALELVLDADADDLEAAVVVDVADGEAGVAADLLAGDVEHLLGAVAGHGPQHAGAVVVAGVVGDEDDVREVVLVGLAVVVVVVEGGDDGVMSTWLEVGSTAQASRLHSTTGLNTPICGSAAQSGFWAPSKPGGGISRQAMSAPVLLLASVELVTGAPVSSLAVALWEPPVVGVASLSEAPLVLVVGVTAPVLALVLPALASMPASALLLPLSPHALVHASQPHTHPHRRVVIGVMIGGGVRAGQGRGRRACEL